MDRYSEFKRLCGDSRRLREPLRAPAFQKEVAHFRDASRAVADRVQLLSATIAQACADSQSFVVGKAINQSDRRGCASHPLVSSKSILSEIKDLQIAIADLEKSLPSSKQDNQTTAVAHRRGIVANLYAELNEVALAFHSFEASQIRRSSRLKQVFSPKPYIGPAVRVALSASLPFRIEEHPSFAFLPHAWRQVLLTTSEGSSQNVAGGNLDSNRRVPSEQLSPLSEGHLAGRDKTSPHEAAERASGFSAVTDRDASSGNLSGGVGTDWEEDAVDFDLLEDVGEASTVPAGGSALANFKSRADPLSGALLVEQEASPSRTRNGPGLFNNASNQVAWHNSQEEGGAETGVVRDIKNEMQQLMLEYAVDQTELQRIREGRQQLEEVSRIMAFFSTKVVEQSETCLQIASTVEKSIEHMAEASKQLSKAKERGSSYRIVMVGAYIGMAVILLLLDFLTSRRRY